MSLRKLLAEIAIETENDQKTTQSEKHTEKHCH